MKVLCITIVATLFMNACGRDAGTSQLNYAIETNPEIVYSERSTVLEDVTVERLVGDVMLENVRFKIAGRVLLGNNSCEAEGKQAKLEQTIKGDIINVSARVFGKHDPARMCTREFMPVYKDLELVVEADTSIFKDIIIQNYGSRFIARSVTAQESVVTNLEVTALDGGDNSGTSGRHVSGDVYLGGNPCHAEGSKAHFELTKKDNSMVLTAIVSGPLKPELRVCPAVYMPVTKRISTDVISFTRNLIVRHVDEMNKDYVVK